MIYLDLIQVLRLYREIMEQSGGAAGVNDLGKLEAALAQPRLTFDGQPLYPTIPEQASALGFALVQNHPFIDGNKRLGHAAMERFLLLNGHEISASVDEQEQVILQLAAGAIERKDFTDWLRQHLTPRPSPA